MKCPESVPIMKNAFGKKKQKKKTSILKGSSAHFIPISWHIIKIEGFIHKGHS